MVVAKLLWLLAFLPPIFFGFGPLDESGARGRGTALLHTIDPRMTREELASANAYLSQLPPAEPGDSLWTVGAARRVVVIDPFSGDLRLYRNDRILALVRDGARPGAPFFATSLALVADAKAKVLALGMTVGPVVRGTPLPRRDAQGNVQRQLLTVEFFDRPHGYPTDHVGNFCVIELDSLTGEVVEIRAGSGYRYGPPTVRIDRKAARRIATLNLHAAIRLDEVSSPAYCVIDRRDAASPEGRACAAAAIAPLCFQVCHKDRSPEGYDVVALASISCDSGAVLARFRGELTADGEPIRGDPDVSIAPHVQREARESRARERVVLGVLLTLAALICVALGFGIKNRKRGS